MAPQGHANLFAAELVGSAEAELLGPAQVAAKAEAWVAAAAVQTMLLAEAQEQLAARAQVAGLSVAPTQMGRTPALPPRTGLSFSRHTSEGRNTLLEGKQLACHPSQVADSATALCLSMRS
jgi:hypothetical protein